MLSYSIRTGYNCNPAQTSRDLPSAVRGLKNAIFAVTIFRNKRYYYANLERLSGKK
jgi:hypothetical protein